MENQVIIAEEAIEEDAKGAVNELIKVSEPGEAFEGDGEAIYKDAKGAINKLVKVCEPEEATEENKIVSIFTPSPHDGELENLKR